MYIKHNTTQYIRKHLSFGMLLSQLGNWFLQLNNFLFITKDFQVFTNSLTPNTSSHLCTSPSEFTCSSGVWGSWWSTLAWAFREKHGNSGNSDRPPSWKVGRFLNKFFKLIFPIYIHRMWYIVIPISVLS